MMERSRSNVFHPEATNSVLTITHPLSSLHPDDLALSERDLRRNSNLAAVHGGKYAR